MSTAVIRITPGVLLPGEILPPVAIVIIIITVTVRYSPQAALPLVLGAVLAAFLAAGQGRG